MKKINLKKLHYWSIVIGLGVVGLCLFILWLIGKLLQKPFIYFEQLPTSNQLKNKEAKNGIRKKSIQSS